MKVQCWKSNFIPFAPPIGNELIMVRGRISSAFIPYCKKHQLIVSGKHTPTLLLLVLYFYEKSFLSERAYFKFHKIKVLDNSKTLICKIINNCSYCKCMTDQSKQPYATSHPDERLSSSPFLYFGSWLLWSHFFKFEKHTRTVSTKCNIIWCIIYLYYY